MHRYSCCSSVAAVLQRIKQPKRHQTRCCYRSCRRLRNATLQYILAHLGIASMQNYDKVKENKGAHDCLTLLNDLGDLHKLQCMVQATQSTPCNYLPRRAPDRPASCGPDIMIVRYSTCFLTNRRNQATKSDLCVLRRRYLCFAALLRSCSAMFRVSVGFAVDSRKLARFQKTAVTSCSTLRPRHEVAS